MQTHIKAMMAEIAEAADQVGEHADALNTEMERIRKTTEVQSDAATVSRQQSNNWLRQSMNCRQRTTCIAGSRDITWIAERSIATHERKPGGFTNVVTTVNAAGQTMANLFQSISAIDRVSQIIRGLPIRPICWP